MDAVTTNDEMVEGYNDGRDADNPEPSENRSHSYRHGFTAGRNDLKVRVVSAQLMRELACEAMAKDEEKGRGSFNPSPGQSYPLVVPSLRSR